MSQEIDKSLRLSSYLAPKHWPLWFAIGLLRLSTFLPTRVTSKLGNALGRLLYYAMPSRRRAARINIRQAYPDFSKDEITALNKKSFESLGISIFEMGVAWYEKDSVLKKKCQVEGKEHLDHAITNNDAIILLTGHFTTLETGGRLIGLYCDKYNAVFKKARSPLFNAIMVHHRSKFFNELIDNKNVRGIIRGLKKGNATWFAPDQDFRHQDIVFTPFLGGIASTLTATAKMAKMTKAAVVPFYQVRLKNNKGFKLIILPALENFPSGDILDDSARVNKAIEDMVYANPEQYLWLHKRFKTQPDKSTKMYPS